MRIWRALKSLGCMALRDGAYLLPADGDREQALQEFADECIREGGNAWLMAVQPRSAAEAARIASCSTAAGTTPNCADRGGKPTARSAHWRGETCADSAPAAT